MSAMAQRRTAAAAAIMMLMTMLQFALLTVNSAPADAAFGGATLFEIDGDTFGADDWDGNAPAYGFTDRGTLAPGQRADLVILDADADHRARVGRQRLDLGTGQQVASGLCN